MNRSLAIGLMY